MLNSRSLKLTDNSNQSLPIEDDLIQKNAGVSDLSPIPLLLIEDDRDVSNAVARVLTKKGFQVQQVFDGQEGLLLALSQRFHLILLDKLLPGLDGFELLKRLRQQCHTPVIMLTACGTEQDRIDGLVCGADDYLPKPFNMTELHLRIQSLLRRSTRQDGLESKHSIEHEGFSLALDGKLLTVIYGKSSQELTPVEFDLLQTFIEHRKAVLSKHDLYQMVLNKPFSRYDRSLDMHVSNLRSKLTSLLGGHRLIKTVRGQGYQLQ